jgi:hypothetical protein
MLCEEPSQIVDSRQMVCPDLRRRRQRASPSPIFQCGECNPKDCGELGVVEITELVAQSARCGRSSFHCETPSRRFAMTIGKFIARAQRNIGASI